MAFGRRLKKFFNPRKVQNQYFGGSQKATEDAIIKNDVGRVAGAEKADKGTDLLADTNKTAAGMARNAETAANETQRSDYRGAQTQMAQDRQGLKDTSAAADARFAGDRASAINDVSALRTNANNIGANYLTTDRMRAQQDMEASQRGLVGSARGLAAGGGGIRAALQAGAGANLQAMQSAGITRATETNDLNSQRTAALQGVSAAGQNIAQLGQAQQAADTASAAGLLANSSASRDAATNRQISLLGAANSNLGQAGTAAGAISAAGSNREMGYLGATTDIGVANLSAAQAAEAAKQKQLSARSGLAKVLDTGGAFMK
jgi:hypothetical protein